MQTLWHMTTTRRLEIALSAFFALVTLSLVVVYAADPAVYAQVLSLASASSAYSLPVTLFLLGILALIALLIIGVFRHWRWLFWLILLAFSAAVLDIPVTLLQLLGVLPALYPTWYSLYRLAIACVQIVIAVWMARVAYQHGAWALGRRKRPDELHTN